MLSWSCYIYTKHLSESAVGDPLRLALQISDKHDSDSSHRDFNSVCLPAMDTTNENAELADPSSLFRAHPASAGHSSGAWTPPGLLSETAGSRLGRPDAL